VSHHALLAAAWAPPPSHVDVGTTQETVRRAYPYGKIEPRLQRYWYWEEHHTFCILDMFHETPSIYTASSSCLTFGNPSLS
jgi:hypothetical protein